MIAAIFGRYAKVYRNYEEEEDSPLINMMKEMFTAIEEKKRIISTITNYNPFGTSADNNVIIAKHNVQLLYKCIMNQTFRSDIFFRIFKMDHHTLIPGKH